MIAVDRRGALLGLGAMALPLGAARGAADGAFLRPAAPLIGATSGPKQFYDLSAFDAFRTFTGIRPDVYLTFGSVDDGWHGQAMQGVFRRDARLMYTLSLRGPDALARTAAGAFDAQLGQVARATVGLPTVVRPYHEMNGRFGESWSAAPPADYLAAWRHMRAVWAKAGNTAPFCWAPNIVVGNAKTVDFEPYYPGDAQCELIGIDGYRTRWFDKPFDKVFGPSLGRLAALGRRPIFLSEVGTLTPVDKAAWIAGMFGWLAEMPFGRRITGLAWWQRDGSAITDPATGRAFADGYARWRAAWSRR